MARRLKLTDRRPMTLSPAGGAGATSRSGTRRAGHLLPRIAFGFLVGCVIAALPVAPRTASAAEIKTGSSMVIEVDKARMIDLDEPAATVFVANPDVADVQVPGAPNVTKFLVFGKKAGNTTVFALTQGGRVTRYEISVVRQVAEIGAALKRAAPNAKVEVASAPNGITVSGSADTPRDTQKLKSAATQFLGDKDSLNFNVAVPSSTQVNLRVRVAEVSRTADKAFGFNWSAIYNNGTIAIGVLTGRAPLNTVVNAVTGTATTTFGDFARSGSPDNFNSIGAGYKSSGGSVNLSVLIDALEAEGLVTVLAEPNLTAISGETANFLAGGEFPVPVSQGLQQITIDWKKFGVSVDFTPTVLDPNRLSIKVRPEVSELSDTGAVVIDNIKIPGLSVRRAATTVELASGQSFAIAGLFQNNASNQLRQLPFLGDLPILGALFRSTRFQRNESELVIIVTPYIVQPAAQTSDLHLPTEGIVFANDLERILLGRLTTARPAAGGSPAAATGMPHLNGSAGFMLER